jgi:hypothetical protein
LRLKYIVLLILGQECYKKQQAEDASPAEEFESYVREEEMQTIADTVIAQWWRQWIIQ